VPGAAARADLPAGPAVSASGCVALNLKGDAVRSDTGIMKFCAHSAPARTTAALLNVRRSLNTPVLAIDQLPVGPATAAIAAHADPRDGLPRYTLAVRSERSRGVVFFSARDEDLAGSEPTLAAEAALSLAEGMGFLFENDAPLICGRAAALIWVEFAGTLEPSAAVAERPATLLLTKFRRPTSWSTATAASAIAADTAARAAASDSAARFESSDRQIAQPGEH
jgi:hypothetical protein